MEEYRGELLAPAGTMDCLKAAIAAGADAVYLGGQRFGARAFAGNFSREELLEGLCLAHLWNRKIYLTVNTLTKQDELSGLCDWIAPFYEAGLDGVIVQDMGVLEKLRKNFPGMELHASTQMTVTVEQKCPVFKIVGCLSDCPGEGIEPGRNSPVKRADRLWQWKYLSMEPCAIAIPDSACFQAFWAEEAETGDAVRSHADSPIRCLDRKQEGAGWAEKVSKNLRRIR